MTNISDYDIDAAEDMLFEICPMLPGHLEKINEALGSDYCKPLLSRQIKVLKELIRGIPVKYLYPIRYEHKAENR